MGDIRGGICKCATGILCVAGTCGGCDGFPGDYCNTSGPVEGSTPGTCCGVGDACKFYGDAYRCCAITGQGGCVHDTDCRDYASGARCKLMAAAGEGDSGALLGICE